MLDTKTKEENNMCKYLEVYLDKNLDKLNGLDLSLLINIIQENQNDVISKIGVLV